jgi:L-lactate dehydrogenase complex protein LldG
MESSGQEKFMGRIRSALGRASREPRDCKGLFPTEPSAEQIEILARIKNRTSNERQQLLERLVEMAQPIKLVVIPVKDEVAAVKAIGELVKEKKPEWGTEKRVVTWRHPLIESLNLPQVLAEQDVPVFVSELTTGDDRADRQQIREHIIDAYIGITSADFCMADTATLVMRNRPGQPRSVAIVPSIHAAVIRLEQIILDMKELHALLKWNPEYSTEGLTNYMSFNSGPSKTADIEATMVHGAHGPREVYIYVLTDPT